MSTEIGSALDLGRACRLARKRQGLRLEEAALAAGVNYRFASELERGKGTAQLERALAYAKALGVRLFCEVPGDMSDVAEEGRP